MPKKRRRAKIPTPAWERPRGTIGSRVLGRSFQFYGAVVVGTLLLVGIGIIGYAFWSDYWEGRGRPGSTAIQVEDTRYRLDYISQRVTMFVNQTGGQAADNQQRLAALPAVSSLLIQEEIVRRFAGEMEVTATDDEIKGEIASRLGITADDESFDVVFQQELARTGISESDYRLMLEAAVLERKLRDRFLEQVPESAESARYRQMVVEVDTEERAKELTDAIEGGADFAALAEEFSAAGATGENEDEVGWVPKGARPAPLDASTEAAVFALEPGVIKAIEITPRAMLVVEMLEKDDDRPVEEDQKGPLADRAFDDWVSEKRQSLDDDGSIVDNMDLTNGDPDKISWVIDSARG